MRRFLLSLTLVLLSSVAWGQYLQRAGTKLKLDGEKLSPEAQTALLADIGGIDCNAAWNKAKTGRNAGMGLIIGGGVAALGGSATFLLGATTSVFGAAIGGIAGSIGGQETAQQAANEGAKAGEPYMTAGLVSAGLGLAALGVGIPMTIINSKKLGGIVDSYNSAKPSAQLTLGPTASGFGLTVSL